MRGRSILAGCLATLAVAAPAGATAIPFGPDLTNLPANNDQGCQASCMWTFVDTYPNTLIAPASGTVTGVRVKVGATTGRMRVNVVRFLFQQNPANPSYPTSSGPYLEAYGPEFTPAADSVTPVATNLPVQVDPTPLPSDGQSIQVIDAIAIEVEETGVPAPIFKLPTALVYPTYPGPTSQGIEAPSFNVLPTYTNIGFGVLANGVVETAGGGVPTGGGPPVTPPAGGGGPVAGLPGTAVPTIALTRASAPVTRGVAAIPLTCQGADCAGSVTLQSGAGAARAVAAKKATTYGTAKFAAKAGKKTTAKVKLNKKGRALLKKKNKAKVIARIAFTKGGGKPSSLPVTLKR